MTVTPAQFARVVAGSEGVATDIPSMECKSQLINCRRLGDCCDKGCLFGVLAMATSPTLGRKVRKPVRIYLSELRQ